MLPSDTLSAIDAFLTLWRNHPYDKLLKLAPAFLAEIDCGNYFATENALDFRKRWRALHQWRSTAAYNAMRHEQLLDG